MKNILVPVDFSETSENALNYAVELAKVNESSLLFIHAFRMPLPVTDMPVVIPMEELEKDSSQLLTDLVRKVKSVNPHMRIETLNRPGFAVDSILEAIELKSPDLIVMGMKGHTGALDKWIGSITTEIFKKTKTPVLAIPSGAKFKMPTTIVLGCDYSKNVPERIMRQLKYYAKLFDAKINVLDIFSMDKETTFENAIASNKLEASLSSVDHATDFRAGTDVVNEIISYNDLHKADWIVMVPHTYDFFTRLFHSSNTKRMAFSTTVPLLSIHE